MTQSGSSPDDRQSIGAYEIQGPLGRGGMGEVFLAWDARLRRRVAIKRVRVDRQLNTPSRERLLREARAAAGLCHPAIVQVYDLIEDAEGDCIVLEYVEGQTLAAELAGGPLDPARAVRLAREIAEGLAAAHEAGIVHRDLKAENVIVTPSGHAKILDFGLARLRTLAADEAHLTQDGVLLGTFHVMSPEQASGGETDERSDLFSLGILLYEMLTGLSPFRGATPSETLKKVLFERPPRVDAVRPGLPVRLGDLVESLLSKEPAARPDSAAEVAHELEGIAASLAAAAAPTWDGSVSSLPTVVEMPRPAGSPPLSRNLPAPASKNGMSAVRGLRMRTVVIALLGMAIVGVLIYRFAVPKPPLRVLVLRPEVRGTDERLQLAASGVLAASLDVLNSLEGVDPIDQTNLLGTPVKLPEMKHAAAANELLVMKLENAGSQASVMMSRQTPNGQILWKTEFPASIEFGNLLRLAKEVNGHLLQGYKGRKLRSALPGLNADPDDYATFLTVKQNLDRGDNVPSEGDLNQLQNVMDRSFNLLGARLLAADILLSRSRVNQKSGDLDRAMKLAIGAHDLAKGDPRPLILQFKIELAQNQLEPATSSLENIKQLLPGDPRVLVLQARLGEQEGRLEGAYKDMRKAVDASPTWRNLLYLANLETRTGRVDDARNHFKQILENSKDNIYALDGLARIELLFGDPGQAEQKFKDLIARTSNPLRAHYTNLGVAQILQGHYAEAILSLKKALDKDKDSADVYLNLAQAELALDNPQANEDFRKALSEIKKNPIPENRLSQAECLAYLHKWSDAAEIIKKALKERDDDPEVLKSAALVYAVVGDQSSAIANIRDAKAKGVPDDWFQLPGFESLRDHLEYKELIKGAPGSSRAPVR